MAAIPPNPESLLAHGDFLRGLARELLGDEHDAEDVVQQTYVRALQTPPRARGLRRWLSTVARRTALNQRRAARRRRHREASLPAPDAVPSTAEIAAREALRRQVLDTVLSLPEPYRTAVLLRHFENLPPARIARRLGLPASTVRTRLQRAHGMLRERLDRAHGGQRGAWSALLLPRTATPAAPTWSLLLMKKTLLAASAAALLAIGWLAFDRIGTPPGPRTAPPAEVAGAPLATAAGDAAGPERRTIAASGERASTGASDPARFAGYRSALAGFRGRVVDAGGDPVPGCGVTLFRLALDALLQGSASPASRAAPGFAAARATTGADGRFELAGGRPRGLFLLRAGIGTEDPTLRIVERAPGPGEVVELGDVALADLAALRGTVLDADGAPLAGAEVTAIDLPVPFLSLAPVSSLDPRGALLLAEGQGPATVLELPPWVGPLLGALPIPRTRTGADGRFTLVGVPSGTTAVAVAGRDHEPLLRTGVPVPAAGADLGVLQLRAGTEVAGTVRDAAGDPVAGAEVLVAAHDPLAPADVARAPVRTDDRGRFSAPGFPSGRVRLAARRAPGHRWITTGPAPAGPDLEILIPSTQPLRVQLISDAGLPVSAPRFTLLAGGGPGVGEMHAFGLVAPIDLTGRVRRQGDRRWLMDLEPGGYTLYVEEPAHARQQVRFEIAAAEGAAEVVVRLRARIALTVRALDRGGAPVPGAAIFARPMDADDGASSVAEPHGITDASGTLILEDVAGEVVELIASHPRFGEAVGRATRADSGGTVTFDEVGDLEGVLHRRGGPVETGRWSVLLLPRRLGGIDLFPPVVRPDAEGGFRIPALQPGSYEVQAVESLDVLLTPGTALELARYAWMPSPRVATAEVISGRTATVRIDVAGPPPPAEPGARLTGTVLVDGRPGTGMVILAQFGPDRPPSITTVDGGGRFDLGHAPAGRCYVNTFDVEQQSFADNQPHMMWSGWLEIAAGVDRELAIDVQTGSLAGTVLDADGRPVTEAWVEARGELATPGPGEDEPLRSRYVVRTDDRGRFEITRMAPGVWQVGSRQSEAGPMHGLQEGIGLAPGQRRTDVLIRIDRERP